LLEAVALDQLTLPLELEDFGLLALEFLALAAQLFALAVKTLFLAPSLLLLFTPAPVFLLLPLVLARAPPALLLLAAAPLFLAPLLLTDLVKGQDARTGRVRFGLPPRTDVTGVATMMTSMMPAAAAPLPGMMAVMWGAMVMM